MSRRIRTLISTRPIASFAGLLLIGLALGLAACDAGSPSEPSQPPGTPPGTSPSNATYSISITLSPPSVPAGSTDPVQVTVRVTRRDNGQPPPSGTTVVVAAGAGSFGAQGGPASVVLQTLSGQASVAYFPPVDVGTGTVIIQARLESSIGQAALQILEPATFFIASVEPNVGSPNGGEPVSILGGGFETPVRVTFGGVPAQVESVAPNRIRVTTPPSTTSVPVGGTLPVAVSVTINLNEIEQASDTLPSAFIYSRGGSVIQPQVFSVTPSAGPNEGGTRITITGEGFQSPIQVVFGSGTSASSFTGIEATVESVTPGRIVVVTPPATGFGQSNQNATVDILVRNLDSGFSTVATLAFQYGSKVIITAVGPGVGPYTGGTIVTIHGQGFDAPVAVTLGGIAQSVISVTGTEIVFRTSGILLTMCPDNGQMMVTGISVTNIESGDGATNMDLGFTYLVPTPLITSVMPTTGPQGGNTLVTIMGQGFEPPVRVRFMGGGDDFAASVQSASSGQVVVRTPGVPNSVLDTEACDDNADGTAGERYIPTTFDVQVENLGTACENTFEGVFTYTPSNQTCRNDVGEPPPPPPVECDDGFDNDADGMIDAADPQCTGPNDDDESA
jgi:hypothetical protein